ncbi:hypothetical protein ASE35_09975 [Lysobacter sp. Root916]|uniref:hypothetical protein n=1 Tax=Lysobacter sp. Root916 TaxID=1736606 RepID=UPI00070DEE72|nr:hypothetical protein [Lysobacter sp. Root916]KRD34065.1 hypothetical protein ASE35_09975 [Lysobacter sp. Root916]
MAVRASRIALWTIALAIVAAAGWVVTRPQPPVRVTAPASWIPIPEGGMDASEYPVRDLLLGNFRDGFQRHFASNAERPLVQRCGDGRPGEPAETYAALIGDHWFVPDQKVWSIEMTSSGEWLDVTIVDGFPVMAPEPAPGEILRTRELRPTLRRSVRKADLADVREAWSAPDLWFAPQTDAHCLDGNIVYLEACVLGRYHARSRTCGATGAADAMTLWRRLRAHFPDPPPATITRVDSP